MLIKNENCTEFVDNMSERIWRGERQQEAVRGWGTGHLGCVYIYIVLIFYILVLKVKAKHQ